MKTFPPPLTADEEKYFLQKYAEGDSDAKDVLIERNLRLVAHIMKKYQNLDEDMEDLLSIGTIGLIKAVNSFKPDKNTKFATYACRCIENEILMLLRSKKKSNREFSLYEPIGTDREGNEIHLYDIMESEEDDAYSQILLGQNILLLYDKLASELTSRERYVLIMRYGLFNHVPQTQNEIASHLNISRSYVSRIEKSALKKLRVFFT